MTYNLNSTLLNLNEKKSSIFLDYPLILFRIDKTKVKRNLRLYFHFYYFSYQKDLISITLYSKMLEVRFEIKDIFNTYHDSIYVGILEYDFEIVKDVNDFIIESFSSSKGKFLSLENKVVNYKFSLTQEYYIEKYNSIVFDSLVVPNLNDVFWQCTCGFVNSNSKRKCGFCKISKETLVNIPLNDSKSFIYKIIIESNPIEFNYDLDFEENMKTLIRKIESSNMNVDDFRNSDSYMSLKDAFMESKAFIFFKVDILKQELDPKKTFEENINNLRNHYNRQGISKEKFNSWVDLEGLNTKYSVTVIKMNQKKYDFYLWLVIGIVIAIIIFIALGE